MEQAIIDQLTVDLESVTARLADMEEEHGGERRCSKWCRQQDRCGRLSGKEALELAWRSLLPETYSKYTENIAIVADAESQLAILKDDARIQALRNSRGNITKLDVNKQLKSSD